MSVVSIVATVLPTQFPVSLDEVRERLHITSNEFDSDLTRILRGAIDYCQEYQWAQYCTATFAERFDGFKSKFEPQKSPVQSVTSVAYADSGGTMQTLVANTDYTVDIYSKPARIVPAYSKWWPASRGHINDVVLTYVAGYGNPADVPDEIKMAILMKTQMQYEACGDQEAMTRSIHSMLDKRSFRVFY